MNRISLPAVFAGLFFAVTASGTIVTYDFETGDDQGWGHKFADPGAPLKPLWWRALMEACKWPSSEMPIFRRLNG